MRRTRLSNIMGSVSRGFRGWRFAAFALTLLLSYNLFVLVVLFAPAPNAEVGEFADNFRQWCFGYEKGGANIHYVINYFVGPILLGAARPVHILTSSATVRRVVNMTAIAVVEAGIEC